VSVLVHFSGPSYSKSVVLQPGAAPLAVGRDAQAGVYLPDDDRLISRRHFTLEWAEGGAKVTVLSKVNGVTTPRGEFGIGQSVVLGPGDTGQLGRYSFQVEPQAATAPAPLAAAAAPPAAAAATDPWGDFASEWLPPGAARKDKARPPAFSPSQQPSLNHAFDDAFSSSTAWRVEDMPDPAIDPLASASFESEAVIGQAFALPPAPADTGTGDAPAADALRALCKGLGIAGPPQLAPQDWERLGQSVRQLVQGLDSLVNVQAGLKKEMRATDRTMLGAPENNPLKGGMPLAELLHYLLFMAQGAAGYMPAQRALQECIQELRAHEIASVAAVRRAIEGAVREFEPDKLRAGLLKGRRSIAAMVDNARLWDLYTAHYQDQGAHMAQWLEQLFNRHFMPAYLGETERLRREARPE
jgi:type VI secretion system FHA domain protein